MVWVLMQISEMTKYMLISTSEKYRNVYNLCVMCMLLDTFNIFRYLGNMVGNEGFFKMMVPLYSSLDIIGHIA